MPIIIYTYSNPYKIDKEPYWAMIKNSFHLCVSQTLVNGLCDRYGKYFYKGKLVTVSRFINQLFNDWESDTTKIVQRATIDNIIESIDFGNLVSDISKEDVINSLRRNRSYVLDSIRIMFELGMNPNNIKRDELTIEQRCVVEIYKELITTKNNSFILNTQLSNDEINKAIQRTIDEATTSKEKREEIDSINTDTIVVHGIHQFSPIMLQTIELLSKHKNVIVLFNYQSDYKNVYQTWLNVYNWFESKTNLPKNNFFDDSQEFVGGRIADNMAAIISGSTSSVDFSQQIDVTEFDNKTEFAGYIAKKFEIANNERAKNGYEHPALYYMEDQIYAADSSVNDILKIYFPDQFGERDFLDYPIGHFFIAITNMWDPSTQSMCINNMNDIYECLSCGIISEKNAGSLVSILDKCKLAVKDETTLSGMVRQITRLKKKIKYLDDDELRRLEYYDLEPNELDILITALNELNEISNQFFVEFNDQQYDFKSFYKKISDVLVKKILDKNDLNEDFKDIVERVLNRLNEVENVEASASFDCLKETMQLYLKQEPKEGTGANWIVRNFEQIDGDVLRRSSKDHKKIYHFACLSDQSMSITHADEFPWPLDTRFFEVAQAPVDWKYQVYVTSRQEYKNFRRYALVYGLAFSKCDIKLSYIKNDSDTENDLYYLIKILNAKVNAYEPEVANNYRKNSNYIHVETDEWREFSTEDLVKYKLCPYKFLLETAIEGNTIYKDEFMIRRYVAILLENRTIRNFIGKNYIKDIVSSYIEEQMDELSENLPFINKLDRFDIIRTAKEYIEKYAVKNSKFKNFKSSDLLYREVFITSLYKQDDTEKEIFKPSTQEEVDAILSKNNLSKDNYKKTISRFCSTCSNKDICLEIFKSTKK